MFAWGTDRGTSNTMNFSLDDLAMVCGEGVMCEDVNDDLEREPALRKQALMAVVQARRLILAAKLSFHPPEGYFCEMIKTKEHMGRIAKRIEEEAEEAKAVEEARKRRHERQYSKKMQKEKITERQQKRAKELKEAKRLHKKARPSNDNAEFDVEVDNDDGGDDDRRHTAKSSKKGSRPKPLGQVSKKRAYKNDKYGSGGKRRGMKRNTKESTDMDTFDSRQNRRPFKGMEGGKRTRGPVGAKRPKKQRPGKQRRQQMRSKRASRQ